MEIDNTIQILSRISQSIDMEVPQTINSPDALVDYLNQLYVKYTKDFSLEEAFEYDDVGRPSITLTVGIEADFDIKKVMENMQTKLQVKPQEKTTLTLSFQR